VAQRFEVLLPAVDQSASADTLTTAVMLALWPLRAEQQSGETASSWSVTLLSESLSRAASICGARSRLTTSHIVKYHGSVHIVTRKHLREAMQEYPDAANEIKAWVAIVEGVRWHNFAEVRLMFRDADYINGYVVFNIRRNRYRLITVIHYANTTDEKRMEGHVYIRSFLTHKEYNDPRKWDRRFGAK
jgi:mRNA interferase HigB